MKVLKYLLIFSLIIFMSGCAASSKNPYLKKKKKSHVGTTQLGRNKYYFSTGYQKKLKSSYKRR